VIQNVKSKMLFKIQRPLTPGATKFLVYDRSREHEFVVDAESAVRRAVRAFFALVLVGQANGEGGSRLWP